MPATITHYMPYIVVFNLTLVSITLIVWGLITVRPGLTETPHGKQNFAEFALGWFVDQAKAIRPDAVMITAPFIATLFFFILCSNLLGILPIPILKIPPTSYYSGPLALALTALLGILVISGVCNGFFSAIKHLVWPNPLQLISEVSDALSLSLRLFGNIGGEFIVTLLVIQTAPYGIPLVIHALGLIPAFIQPLVFTLLTTNFMASALHVEKKKKKVSAEAAESEPGATGLAIEE